MGQFVVNALRASVRCGASSARHHRAVAALMVIAIAGLGSALPVAGNESTAVQAAESHAGPRTEVHLQEMDDGAWVVSFRFPQPQRAVVMRQAPEPYRGGMWTSRTDGVEMETLGDVDAIVFDQPGRDAVFEIQPYTAAPEKAYTPFLAFTDGSWGVLEGQFRMSSAADRAAVEAFEGNGETWGGELLDYSLVIESPRRIFHNGHWSEAALELSPKGDGTYVYVGDADMQREDNFAGFIDSGLPAWIRDQLDSDLEEIFDVLAAEWGLTLPEPVEVLFVFEGAERPGLHQTGGVLGRKQIALQVSGDALLEPDTSIVDFFRWFLTHESVHVFQGAAGMEDIPSAHAWMHEGGANTMAHRIGGRIAGDRDAFLREVYGRAFADCVEYLEAGAPLSDALKTSQFGAYYACGDLVGLVTEAHLDEGDIFDFWKRFLDEASARYEGETSIALYFEVAEEAGLSASQIGQLRALVTEPVSAPRETLTELLESAGLEPRFDEDGRLESMAIPH